MPVNSGAANGHPDVTAATEALQDEPSALALLPPGSALRQVVAAYFAAGAKILAWVIAAAVVYRLLGAASFALFMLLRGTLTLLNYTAFGLGPAVLHFGTRGGAARLAHVPATATATAKLEYQRLAPPLAQRAPQAALRSVLLNAAALTLLLTTAGVIALAFYETEFRRLHQIPFGLTRQDLKAVWWLGLGVLLRAAGDVPGGAIQARGWFTLDQAAVAAADLLWAVMCVWIALAGTPASLPEIMWTYAFTGAIAAASRWALAIILVASVAEAPGGELALNSRMLLGLLAYGGLVTLGSVGDFLYAPIAYIILNNLVDPLAVAVYAPAVQIDAALILLVTALAAVVLPRAALRHASADRGGVWREYVRASLAAAAITLCAGVIAWLSSPWLFDAWLGDPLPQTQAILPLVLAHTVLGSAGGIGRSTLIAVGRAGVYATSVLIGGVLNVALAIGFVYVGWGIRGVIWATIISIFGRCVLWMPWYVRRSLFARGA